MNMNHLGKLAAVLTALAGLAAAAPQWQNWKCDPQLTGRSVNVGASSPDLKWTFDTGDTFTIRNSAPVIGSDGTVYFTGQDSFLFAVSPSGSEKWRYKTGGLPNCPALDANGRIYVSVNNFEVLALDDSAAYAKRVWSWGPADTMNYGGSPLVVGPDRTVYACFDAMYAIDSAGALKWQANRGESNAYPPAVSRDGQYLYCEYCPDAFTASLLKLTRNGAQVWARTIGSAPGDLTWGSPCIGLDSTVYAYAAEGRLYAVRPNNTEKWAAVSGLGNFLYISPSLGRGDTIWSMNRQRRPVYRLFSPATGAKVFEDSITVSPSRYNYYNSMVTDALGQAYIMLRDTTGSPNLSTLYAFNPDGSIKWTRPFPKPMLRAMPAIAADSTIYVCNGHYLYAVKQEGIGAAEPGPGRAMPGAGIRVAPSPCRAGSRAAILLPGGIMISGLAVRDAAGRTVRNLTAPAAGRSLEWDGRDELGRAAGPGVYFCTARIEGRVHSVKFVIAR